jgi:hypothetical protein
MYCVDCMVEDHVMDTPAITISNGFALCGKHLVDFMRKFKKDYNERANQYDEMISSLDGFLDSFEE